MHEGSKTICLARFATTHEANYVKDCLEQNGISCILQNEYGNQLYPLFPSSVGGIQLLVFEEDVPEAQTILADIL